MLQAVGNDAVGFSRHSNSDPVQCQGAVGVQHLNAVGRCIRRHQATVLHRNARIVIIDVNNAFGSGVGIGVSAQIQGSDMVTGMDRIASDIAVQQRYKTVDGRAHRIAVDAVNPVSVASRNPKTAVCHVFGRGIAVQQIGAAFQGHSGGIRGHTGQGHALPDFAGQRNVAIPGSEAQGLGRGDPPAFSRHAVDQPHGRVDLRHRLRAVVGLQFHCAVLGDGGAVDVVPVQVQGDAVVLRTDTSGKRHVLLQLDNTARRGVAHGRAQAQIVGLRAVLGRDHRRPVRHAHGDRPVRVLRRAVSRFKGVAVVHHQIWFHAGEFSAGDFRRSAFGQADPIGVLFLHDEGTAGQGQVRAAAHIDRVPRGTGKGTVGNGQSAGVGAAVVVQGPYGCALGLEGAAGNGRLVIVQYRVAVLTRLGEDATVNGQHTIVVVLHRDLTAREIAATDGQSRFVPTLAGLGLAVGPGLRLGPALPTVADQAGIDAGVLIGELHRHPVLYGHGTEVFQHIPAISTTIFIAGACLQRPGIGPPLQGNVGVDIVIYRAFPMEDAIHRSRLLRRSIRDIGAGTVVRDGVARHIGQPMSVEVDLDRPIRRNDHILCSIFVQCDHILTSVCAGMIRSRVGNRSRNTLIG